MKAQWEQMSPNMKRGLSVAGIAGGLILMVMVFSPNPDDDSSSRNRQETIRHILTDTNTRDVGVDSLAANVKLLSEAMNSYVVKLSACVVTSIQDG